MPQLASGLSLALAVILPALTYSAAYAGEAAPLVDCSEKRFRSGNKADSLLGWSNHHYKQAKKAREDKSGSLERICVQLVSMRGDAYCQSPKNETYREALVAALAVCRVEKGASSTSSSGASAKTTKATGKPLVDCSQKRFQSGVSVKGLMSWSDAGVRDIKKTEGTGIYPKHKCEKAISQRGDAHCQKPGDAAIREKLQAALELCRRLQFPAPATKRMLVDCKLKRFKQRKPVPEMVKWSINMTSALHTWSAVAAEAKCQQAYSFAGSAHCMLPNDASARSAVRLVPEVCAQDQERRQAAARAATAAEAKRVADLKANRKMSKLPRSTYKGSGAKKLGRTMRKALVAGRVAKSAKEISKVYPMGSWKSGRFSNTKLPYKMITGLVLWADDDKDGVCRFTSYNFEKIKKKSWGRLRFRSFCMGCPEGWTRCKKGK